MPCKIAIAAPGVLLCLCAFTKVGAAADQVVIGDIDDLSGVYADVQGQGGIEAIQMAIADAGGTSDLVVPAATECLHRAGQGAMDIDCVLVATITPDHLTPSTAATVIGRLGAHRAWGFDLSAACSGFLYGLVVG